MVNVKVTALIVDPAGTEPRECRPRRAKRWELSVLRDDCRAPLERYFSNEDPLSLTDGSGARRQ